MVFYVTGVRNKNITREDIVFLQIDLLEKHDFFIDLKKPE